MMPPCWDVSQEFGELARDWQESCGFIVVSKSFVPINNKDRSVM